MGRTVERSHTPSLVFSIRVLQENAERFVCLCDEAFTQAPTLIFPLKVASRVEIAAALAAKGFKLEVMSFRELEIAKEVAPGGGWIISGSAKKADFIGRAVSLGAAIVNCESVADLDEVNAASSRSGGVCKVLLRLPAFPGRMLGMDFDVVSRILANAGAYPHIEIVGVHMHPGSNVPSEMADTAIGGLVESFCRLRDSYPWLAVCNFGSGMPSLRCNEPEVVRRLQAIADHCERNAIEVMLEPGRPIVGGSGTLYASITGIDREHKRVYVDTSPVTVPVACGADSDLRLITGPLRSRIAHPIEYSTRRREELDWAIQGIWPAEGDLVFAQGLDGASAGDVLVIGEAGAYSLGFLSELGLDGVEVTFE